MKLKALQTTCLQTEGLKPFWDTVVLSTCKLIPALSRKIDDSIDYGQVQPETRMAIEVAELDFDEKCQVLLDELDRRKIGHPPKILVFDVFELFL